MYITDFNNCNCMTCLPLSNGMFNYCVGDSTLKIYDN